MNPIFRKWITCTVSQIALMAYYGNHRPLFDTLILPPLPGQTQRSMRKAVEAARRVAQTSG